MGNDTKQIRKLYEEEIYGTWREGEDVRFTCLGPDPKGEEAPAHPFAVRGGELVRIEVSTRGRSASFVIHAYLPKEEDRISEKGAPFFICMHPIQPAQYALSRGYALLVMECLQIATDDIRHEGAFYELYPYGADPKEQTGVLMAWAWGASKVLDAVKAGLHRELSLDPDASIVTGVSRWGKATAVCGAFDRRIRMTVPACSGAGGLALFDVFSEGKTFDLRGIGGPEEYTYGKNEPLECLQSDAERGWFCDAFLKYRTPEEIPVEQSRLPVLAMDPERYYFIIAACMGEDWVNAPSMWECYKRADRDYAAAGLSDHLAVHFHKEGHAVLQEDLELLIPYFNRMYLQKEEAVDLKALKTSVYEGV
ncbi:MAG: hypothetical protein K6E92_07055 [Lachnospiraceae bacterium]|nr:hypothetical protein [Lachnospiraceae bacterium]